jgi:hypothetical protein
MAPAASKQVPEDKASEMVKSFRVAIATPDGVETIGRIRLDNNKTRDFLAQSIVKTLKGEGNKASKRAAACLGGAAIIQAKIIGKVDDSLVIPIVGRGDGRDTTDKSFYKGNGDIVLTPDMFIERDGMLFGSDAQHEEALKMVEHYFDEKVKKERKNNRAIDAELAIRDYTAPPVASVSMKLPAAKKAKNNMGTAVAKGGTTSCNVSLESPDGDSKKPAFVITLPDDKKAKQMDAMFSDDAAKGTPVAIKAKMYDAYMSQYVVKKEDDKE